MGEFAPHAILQKRKERKCGEKEKERTRVIGIAEENREELWKYREL
jgi:hypothetical protein